MKLQLALDTFSIQQSLNILEELADVVDIVEIGTPMIVRDGVHAVKAVKTAFPKLSVLADVKIMDGGKQEAESAFEAGADIVTVLAVAEDQTIKNVVESGKQYGRQVMADMIAVRDFAARANVLDTFGLDYMCVHTAFDIQHTGQSPLYELKRLKETVKHTKTAVAGGIKPETLSEIVEQKPDIVIVGGEIASSNDKRAIAVAMKNTMNESSGI